MTREAIMERTGGKSVRAQLLCCVSITAGILEKGNKRCLPLTVPRSASGALTLVASGVCRKVIKGIRQNTCVTSGKAWARWDERVGLVLEAVDVEGTRGQPLEPTVLMGDGAGRWHFGVTYLAQQTSNSELELTRRI